MVDLLATILKADGFEVDTDTDGRSAQARLLAEPPDLVLLDLMMPDLDGMELLKLLRLDPKGSLVPVLVVSARTGHQDQLGTLQLGANAYICKPFSPRELVRQVRQLLAAPQGETSA
jgi:DNA-binding response OmpR family regulator